MKELKRAEQNGLINVSAIMIGTRIRIGFIKPASTVWKISIGTVWKISIGTVIHTANKIRKYQKIL